MVSVVEGGDDTDRSQRRSILLKCLKDASPAPSDTVFLALPDLFQAWSFATEASHDDLLFAIPSLLALVLSVISSLVEFRQIGVQLCHSILRRESLRVLDKTFEASRSRSHLISPCFDLLTEIVSFDGGACAWIVYKNRHVTWKRVVWSLCSREGYRKPSKRNISTSFRQSGLKYVLANLRFQSVAAREDLISVPGLLPPIFKNIFSDPGTLIAKVIETFKDAIILNTAIARSIKQRILSDGTLGQIGGLYRYQASGDHNEGLAVQKACHEFLLLVCTSRGCGVLVEQSGWYPPGLEDTWRSNSLRPIATIAQGRSLSMYLDSVPVRNKILSVFIQTLRPHADLRQRDLLLAIFEAAPELVADYFLQKKASSFEPLLSAIWLGYAAFVASVQMLPCPSLEKSVSVTYRPPPPTSVVLQGILPQTLTQAAMTRCLNQSSTLIKLLITRVIILAFRKADIILKQYGAGENVAEWENAATEIVSRLSQQLPEKKHVASAFRTCSEDQPILRHSLAYLLSLYAQLAPQLALQENFDISVTIAEALTPSPEAFDTELTLQPLEFEKYLEMAHQSTEMRWWNGPGRGFVSPLGQSITNDGQRKFDSPPMLLPSKRMCYLTLMQVVTRGLGFCFILLLLKITSSSKMPALIRFGLCLPVYNLLRPGDLRT